LIQCPRCGEYLGENVKECFKCGTLINKKREEEKNYILKKTINDEYEYDTVSIVDDSGGLIDNENIKLQINNYSRNGWRLINVICNETSRSYPEKNDTFGESVGHQTILFFERKIKSGEFYKEVYKERLLEIKKIEEKEMAFHIEEKRLKLPSVNENEKKILSVFNASNDKMTVSEINEKLSDEYQVMELLTYLQRLVDKGFIVKDGKDYKKI
jgi:hypothetical protein